MLKYCILFIFIKIPTFGYCIDWPHYTGNIDGTRYSQANQIHADNFDSLKIIWQWRPSDHLILSESPEVMNAAYKSTPIVIEGVLYTSSPLNIVSAINASTGEVIWEFDPKSWNYHGYYPSMHRGVSFWKNEHTQRIIFGTGSGFLFSLDAKTGIPDRNFGIEGKIDLTKGLRKNIDRSLYALISPPTIIGNIVVVGSSIADPRNVANPNDMPPGDVRAFDVLSGKLLWTFETIPQNHDYGVETWTDSSWQVFGAANVWAPMTVDSAKNYIYLPVSTASNDFYGGDRKGDNLFSDSIVCLDATTGVRIWHFQLVHHGLWDYDPPAAPLLININNGKNDIPAVVVLSKQGYIYCFNRYTGDPIWPIVEIESPNSDIPGEHISPTQPHPTWPRPIDRQGLSLTDVVDFTPEIRKKAIDLISNYRFGPLYTPPSEQGTILVPGLLGGSDWAGASWDHDNALLYVPSRTLPFLIRLNQHGPLKNGTFSAEVQEGISLPNGIPITKPPYGRITAVNMVTGEHEWIRPMGRGPVDHPDISHLDISEDLGWPVRTFTIATPTLLLTASGDPNKTQGLKIGSRYSVDAEPSIVAWNKSTGKKLGVVDLPSNASGGPITYMANERQFIVVPLGDGDHISTELVALAIPLPEETLPPQGANRSDSDHDLFYAALNLIHNGDIKQLEKMLNIDSNLSRATGFNYKYAPIPHLKSSTLLHLVFDDHQTGQLPTNPLALARTLLNFGSDPNAQTAGGKSALEIVIENRIALDSNIRKSIVKLFLDYGANPNEDNGRLIWSLIVNQDIEMALSLEEYGGKLDLKYAASLGKMELVASFFYAKGKLKNNIPDFYRLEKRSEISDQFLINEALHFAVFNGNKQLAKFLLSNGAEINSMIGTWWGWDQNSTTMHKAVYGQQIEMLKFLSSNGADPTIKDQRWDADIVEWSSYTGNPDIIQLSKEILRSFSEGTG